MEALLAPNRVREGRCSRAGLIIGNREHDVRFVAILEGHPVKVGQDRPGASDTLTQVVEIGGRESIAEAPAD
jgi:hypothetical protein